MGQVANVALSDTFDTWRIRSNQSFSNLFEINPTANTVSANSVTTSALVVNGTLTIPNTSIGSTKVAFLANTNSFIATKQDKSTANTRLANTNNYIATMITVANAATSFINAVAGSISSNTFFATGVITSHAIPTNAITSAKIADGAVVYNKLNANTAHVDRNNNFAVAQRGTIKNLGVFHGLAGNTVTLTMTEANHYELTSNSNLTFANPTLTNSPGQSGSVTITSNGSYTVSWGSNWRFATGAAPTFSTAAGKQDRVDYYVYSSNTIHAVATIDLLGTA
jgi:hypothetical protein